MEHIVQLCFWTITFQIQLDVRFLTTPHKNNIRFAFFYCSEIKGKITWTAQLWISRSLQVYDDEGLLACCALSETHIQTAGRGPRPLPRHDSQPGQSSSPHHTRKKHNCVFLKWMIDFFFSSFFTYRSIWSCQCLWTNIPPATRTPAAPPAPRARTLSSPTTLELRSPACQNSLPTPTGQPLRNADTSSPFRQTLTFPPLPASWGWTLPHLPRDEAKKKTLVLCEKRSLETPRRTCWITWTEECSRFPVLGGDDVYGALCINGSGSLSRCQKKKRADSHSSPHLGIPRVRRIERTDDDYVRFFFVMLFLFPSMVVSSVVKDNILLFRPNPENILPRDMQHRDPLHHSLSSCKYS